LFCDADFGDECFDRGLALGGGAGGGYFGEAVLQVADDDLTCDMCSRLARPQLADLRFHSPHGVILCTNRGRKVA
jgi:hypothetical protein